MSSVAYGGKHNASLNRNCVCNNLYHFTNIHCHDLSSGNQSQAMMKLNPKIKEAGRYLDLPVIDHLNISGDDGYYSFADEGLL